MSKAAMTANRANQAQRGTSKLANWSAASVEATTSGAGTVRFLSRGVARTSRAGGDVSVGAARRTGVQSAGRRGGARRTPGRDRRRATVDRLRRIEHVGRI